MTLNLSPAVSRIIYIFSAMVFSFCTTGNAMAEVNEKSKIPSVLVELFTSEGCSSCPSADSMLSKLETQPIAGVQIITLSEHVTYWNYLGWTDPYSLEIFSKRQQQYASIFQTSSVYTPQIIVDGKKQFVPSDYSKAIQAIRSSASSVKAEIELMPVIKSKNEISLTGSIRLKKSPTTNPVAVYVALVEDNQSSVVKSGENTGRTLSHSSVARDLIVLDKIKGQTFILQHKVLIPQQLRSKTFRVVLFIQGTLGEILGAKTAPVK